MSTITFTTLDIILVIAAYVYVGIIFMIGEKGFKKHPKLGRKFIHIMTGNIIFFMLFFSNSYVPVITITIPIIIILFLISEHSPIKIPNMASAAGHGLGLVYYALIWTILLLIFPNDMWIAAIGVATMAYGDGLASVIGEAYGKHEYNIGGDPKTIEGSITMFIVITIMISVVILFYNYIVGLGIAPVGISPAIGLIPYNILAVIGVSAAATIAEGITPKGLDNITAGAVAALLYYAFICLI